MNKLRSAEAMQADIQDEHMCAAHVLQSENGIKLMAVMKRECDIRQLMGDTPYATAYNCGKRDVYKLLEDIMRSAE